MTKFTLVLVALGFALFVGAAQAGTIQDLAQLGYTVQVSNPGPAGQNCPTYYVSGHGVGLYMNCNTSQSDIDSLANPTTICNADWQINHPDQLQALNSIRSQGWSVTGDQCADVYTVTNPNTGVAAYSGPGAGLVQLAGSIGTPPAAPQTPGAQTTTTTDPGTGQCLPLCSTPTTTVTTPATTTATTTTTASTSPVNVTVNVTVNEASQAQQQPTITLGTNRVLASALSTAMKQTVVFTSKTKCRIKVVLIPCWKVLPRIVGARKITLTGKPGFGGVAVTSLTLTP